MSWVRVQKAVENTNLVKSLETNVKRGGNGAKKDSAPLKMAVRGIDRAPEGLFGSGLQR